MKRLFLLLFSICTVKVLLAQTLSKEEKKLVALINKQMPQTLELLEKLVNINSGTLNLDGVRQNGAIMRKEFDRIGFSTEWIAMPDSMKRAGHLVAFRKGTKGKKIMLIGHLDTVFEPDMTPNPYRKLNDSTVTGQGVVDMKGGNMIILAALQALHQLGYLKDATITAYFTGDEEKGGFPREVARGDFIERAKAHDIALGFEGGKLNSVVTGRRGASSWELQVTGIQGHSSGIFSEKAGYGAIYETARILDSFRTALSSEKNLTLSPGIIAGGTEVSGTTESMQVSGKDNIIAAKVLAAGDLRFLSEQQKESARAKMRAIVSGGNLNGTTATISFADGIPSMEPTEGNNKLLAQINQIGLAMGMGITTAYDPGSRGAGDISYVAQYVDCLDGLGASGQGSHAPGETMNLKEFPLLVQRAAVLIYRLVQNPK